VTWDFQISRRAEKQIRKLGHEGAQSIRAFLENEIRGSERDPRQHPQAKRLSGNLGGLWRWRVGVYRIVGEVVENILRVSVPRSITGAMFTISRPAPPPVVPKTVFPRAPQILSLCGFSHVPPAPSQ
jgi:mRNA interferase RelE/StbE